ncbi:methyltransferase domain-containing protein [Saccharothrix sp. SC076]|nr:methyltransferase [Saccharothrix obliqua]MBW4722355.1 methyltransferase domain-containing protein [Saccharothrix obliqua]
MSGHWQTRLLMTAVESDLFTLLSHSPANAAELAGKLGFRMPGARDFLLALHRLGLLELVDDVFRNTPVADRYLVHGRPEYIGGYLLFCDRELNPAWNGLSGTLRTGVPSNPAAVTGSPYEALYQDDELADSFLSGMDMFNTHVAVALSELDWTRYHTFVDVGGARGNLAHHLVRANPHLSGVVFDLPHVEPVFTRHMATLETNGSVTFQGGDFFTDPLPAADVLILGHVLHNWSPADRVRLLRNVHRAVNPGGSVVVYDPMVGDRTPPLYSLLAGLSMRVWSAGGQEYSVEDCHGWLREAGFRPDDGGSRRLGDDSLVIAHKDR